MTFDLYPAIDLRGGRVVRLHQGDFDQETVYGDDPIAVAQSFERAGAPWIHVVDLDAARRTGSNRDVVVAIARAVSVRVQTGGGVRDASLLADGIERVVIGSAAVEDPTIVRHLAAEYPGRIAGRTRSPVRRAPHARMARLQRGASRGAGRPSHGRRCGRVRRHRHLTRRRARRARSRGPSRLGDAHHGARDRERRRRQPRRRARPARHRRCRRDRGKAIYEGRFGVDEAVLACAR